MNRSKILSAAAVLVTLAAPAVADPTTPKLHPVDEVCVDYTTSGQMQSGESTRCHRDFAYEMYEIMSMTIGIGGFGQTQNTHTITVGETIYNINLENNTATKTTNPMYQGMLNALSGSSPEEMSAAMMAQMGLSPTGASQTIAGLTCNVFSSQMVGSVCFTDDWVMLEQSFMGTTQRATSVSYESGEAANYTLYQTMAVTDGPDLSNGINLDDLMSQFPQ